VGKNGGYVSEYNCPRPLEMFVKVVMCWLLSHEPFVCLQNQEKKTKQAGSQARQERQEKAKKSFL
jgi:adenine-specific DNA methylase